MTPARYDGHADWYDETFRRYGDDDGSAGALARLVGSPQRPGQVCLDVGCGTGLHGPALRRLGWRVAGLDLSADQLRLARPRADAVLLADAARLPFADASVPSVVMTFVHTDLDDFPAAVAAAARVLAPGGRLVHLGVHPCFVAGSVDRTDEPDTGRVQLGPGYGQEGRRHDPSGRFPMRARFGVRYLSLGTLLRAFLDRPELRLTGVEELDSGLRPWRPDPQDGRVVPWNLAITARRVAAHDGDARDLGPGRAPSRAVG